jgi:MOSC domain-containing protein YiiM
MSTEQHRTALEINAGLPDVRQSPAGSGALIRIVVRPASDERQFPEQCELSTDLGIPGDRWAKSCRRRLPDGSLNPDTQLTLMSVRVLSLIAGAPERWPLAGDNLLVDFDLSQSNLPAGQRLAIGSAVLEITETPHTGCSKFSHRFGNDALNVVNSVEGRLLRLRGVNARVLTPGTIRIGDRITKRIN